MGDRAVRPAAQAATAATLPRSAMQAQWVSGAVDRHAHRLFCNRIAVRTAPVLSRGTMEWEGKLRSSEDRPRAVKRMESR